MADERIFFNLEAHELTSSTWLKIKEQLVWELAKLRELNDGSLDVVETAMLRGRIKQLKIFLTYGNDREADDSDASE